MYYPLNYEQLNLIDSTYQPSNVKSFDNNVFDYWVRSLFQRSTSVFEFKLPDYWQGSTKDFFIYCLFKFGFVSIFRHDVGLVFQPCTLNKYNMYYQPIECLISNPTLGSLELNIGRECELLKLTPDYRGVWDCICYYAEKLATLDSAINMNIINSKFAYIIGAKSKSAAETMKVIFDKINNGEPAVFFDKNLIGDKKDEGEPWQFLERSGLNNSYFTTDMLLDFQTILNNFDAEIGIPTIPYQKKERLVTSEADSRQIDSTSRSIVWFECLESSLENVKKLYPELELSISLRYKRGGMENDENDVNRDE